MSADRHTFDRFGCKAKLVAFAAILASFALLLNGCSAKERYHSALVVLDEDISRGTSRGKGLIASGANPSDAYAYRVDDVNIRVSSEVILRSAGLGLPADEIAYQIAAGGDSSDAGIRRAIASAIKTMERELKAMAIVQVSKTRDPASIEFVLRSSTGTEYPPIAVETPTFLRDVTATYDPTATAAALYAYTIHFPARGGPGVPPIGPTVRSLALLVKDGEYEARADFPLVSRSEK
ncbi:MAG TPA: hypothetical protein VMY87_02065 [Armatimonadota bacterium]|nr:hypothetical protein [Armatimonadota bacterium]